MEKLCRLASQQRCSGPQQRSLSVKVAGAPLAQQIILQAIELVRSLADACYVIILVNVTRKRNPCVARSRAIRRCTQHAVAYTGDQCKREHSSAGGLRPC